MAGRLSRTLSVLAQSAVLRATAPPAFRASSALAHAHVPLRARALPFSEMMRFMATSAGDGSSGSGSGNSDGGDKDDEDKEKKSPRTRRTSKPSKAESTGGDADGGEGQGQSIKLKSDGDEGDKEKGGSESNNKPGKKGNGDGGDSGDDDDDDPSHGLVRASHSTSLVGPAVIPDEYPEVLVLPVSRNPVFPKFFRVLEISDKSLIAAVKKRVKLGQPYAGAFLKRDENDTAEVVKNVDQIYPVGTFVHIQEFSENPIEGKMRLLLMGYRRLQLTGVLPGHELFTVSVDNLKDLKFNRQDRQIKALSNEILSTIRDIIRMSQLYRESLNQIMDMGSRVFNNPSHVADLGAMLCTAEAKSLQAVLEEPDLLQRLNRSLDLVKQEYLQNKLQQDIGKEVEDRLNKSRRQYMLREQLNVIRRELGLTKDDKDAVADKIRDRLKDLKLTDAVKKVIDEELTRLQFLESSSSEFNVSKNYLDWLTAIPWGKSSVETLDLVAAGKVLDEDHYGMKDVKQRVLEFIAVNSLVGSVQGKIVCFVGPPGVGKTSIARSIAKALGRTYYRFSVGGLHDVAEIKGHRRTYIGAMPGKPIQCLKTVGFDNPLILIDEIDKIGRGHNGDPTSALLELLDPEQNKAFLDHYLDVPVDLSKVLFVCTANTTDTIPGPLLDRMEVIQLSGYMPDEKVAIAKNYLIPTAIKSTGLTKHAVTLTDDAILKLIRMYCRESGVRNLNKHVEKIFRKAALKIVQQSPPPIIDGDQLVEYVGQPVFTSERMFDTTPTGVVMGLAWTSMGGSTLYFETVALPRDGEEKGEGHLRVTGQLGDVMKESSAIAYSVAKMTLARLDSNNKFLFHSSISMHVPEGATPKDGPSAGCTMVTALLSLATATPVRQNFAMTGEISLTGKVLRVGGIKEKILAAKRSGVNCVVLPESNRADFEELPKELKADLEVHFAANYEDVLRVALPCLAK